MGSQRLCKACVEGKQLLQILAAYVLQSNQMAPMYMKLIVVFPITW